MHLQARHCLRLMQGVCVPPVPPILGLCWVCSVASKCGALSRGAASRPSSRFPPSWEAAGESGFPSGPCFSSSLKWRFE